MISDAPRPIRWQPIAVALPFVIAVAIYAEATKVSRRDPRLFLAAALIGAVVAAAVWVVPPAWSLSAAFALSMFGANWQTLGVPRLIAPDRIVLGLTLVAITMRAPGCAHRPPIRFRPLYALMYLAGVYAFASALAVGTLSSHNAVFDLLDRMQILDWIVFIVAPAASALAEIGAS